MNTETPPTTDRAHQAMRTETVVAMDLTQLARAWPLLADTSRQVGVRSVLALPLHVDRRPAGTLNLYSAAAAVPHLTLTS